MSQRSATPCKGLPALLSLLAFFIVNIAALSPTLADTPDSKHDGIFLVATEQLYHSSFRQTVILLTHFSKRGATGLTINRPAGVPLQQVFPKLNQFSQRSDPLYLGGPVNSNALFVLLRTNTPTPAMRRIADDIYFSTGKNAFAGPLSPNTRTRTYAGYAGWSAGQLQNEIKRGDWLMVRTPPGIIFEEDPDTLWQRLSKQWKGKWI